jgi:hypothetical protein
LKVATASEKQSGANCPRVEACGQKGAAEPTAREIRPQAKPDDEDSPVGLEREVADQLALIVVDGEVGVAAAIRVEELGEILLVRDPVVEREGLGVAPTRNGLGVRLRHRPEAVRHGRYPRGCLPSAGR